MRDEQRHGVRLGEGRVAGEHLEGDTGQRVDVGAMAAPAAAEALFGRHVAGCADVVARLRVRGADGLGDAEVGEVRPARLVDEDVGGLHVPMDDAAAVRVVERLGDRPQDRERPHPVHAAVLEDVGKGRPGHQPHGEVHHAVGFTRRVHGHDRGVLEVTHRARLVAEPPHEVRVEGQRTGEHLERHRSVDPDLVGPVDVAHPAVADQPVHHEVADAHRSPSGPSLSWCVPERVGLLVRGRPAPPRRYQGSLTIPSGRRKEVLVLGRWDHGPPLDRVVPASETPSR